MACNYWVSNSVTSFNDSCLPAETTFPSITKAGRLNILYSMIFNKSSSFTKVASLPYCAIACWVVSYKVLHLRQPVPNTLISIIR